MKKAASWLANTLQYRFESAELLQQALTHRSASHRNNERFEFLGDAVLGFIISDIVYRLHPDAPEGDLSKLRASLVKDEALAELASGLGLGEHLILGSGEHKTGGHRRGSILADALEAIFAAVFLDSGIDAAKTVVERVYEQRIMNLPDIADLRDPKTRLQEWLQARKMALPIYDLVGESGKDHNKRFTISCTVRDRAATTEGTSTTRRKAEQRAAQEMLALISEKQR